MNMTNRRAVEEAAHVSIRYHVLNTEATARAPHGLAPLKGILGKAMDAAFSTRSICKKTVRATMRKSAPCTTACLSNARHVSKFTNMHRVGEEMYRAYEGGNLCSVH